MRTRPLSLRASVFLLGLPFVFFLTATGAIIFSSAYLLGHPISISKILGISTNYSIFGSQPPARAVLGETLVPEEARPLLMRHFLASYNSPLTPYVDYILAISEKYGLDWRLLVGIAGNESLFGRVTPYNCYNAWGWGIHSRGTLCFSSWEEGIEKVAKGIKEKYIDQGLTTIELIMTRYAPVSVANGYPWADKVKWFMICLERGQGNRECPLTLSDVHDQN